MSNRILVVDDIVENREILRRRLERQGYVIDEAIDGQDALNMIGQQTFDLVLLDIVMPKMGGLEALELIRREHSASALPVIMVSACSQSADVAGALALGANDYVTKPLDFQIVFARISTQLERKQAQDHTQQATAQLRANLETLR